MEVDAYLRELVDTEVEFCRRRALANLQRWGFQDLRTVVICMVEELGEVAREVLDAKDGIDSPALERLGTESRDLGALCFQLGILCELPGRVRREGKVG